MRGDIVQEQWAALAERLRQRWRKLTAGDVAYPYGSSEYLVRILQARYGIDTAEALLQVHEFTSGMENDAHSPPDEPPLA